MSDFLPPRDWTPDDDNEPDRVELLRQCLLKQLDREEAMGKLITQLAERQTEITNTFAGALVTLADHMEQQERELKSLRLIVRMLVAQTP